MNFTTLLSHSSSSILRHLSKLSFQTDSALLFALSANATNLETITSRLGRLASQTVGCISSPLKGDPDLVVCSLARISSKHCIPFRSELPGRAPAQVGRWNRNISIHEQELPSITFSKTGKALWENTGDIPPIPSQLRGQSDIKTLVYFSEDGPENFLRSLKALPQAAKLGLAASSTPFITGQPFTLFYNENVYSSGTVGLAITHHPRPVSATAFHGLTPLSEPVIVSKSEGNMILELNHSNPSKLLVEAITASSQGVGKDDQFYLGHLDPTSETNHQLQRVYRILSGDPSRGSIALDAETAPEENVHVQFFYRPPSDHTTTLGVLDNEPKHIPSIDFSCTPLSEEISAPGNSLDEEAVRLVPDRFIAASENGIFCTGLSSLASMWKCAVPGTISSLKWAIN